MNTSALIELLKSLDLHYTDQIIPGRGEHHVDPTSGMNIIRYRREGVPGEFCVQAKVTHSDPWVNPNTITGKE